MQRLLKALTTSIGLKIVVALTGAGLLGFVIVHMLGNLQVFLGQDVLNSYGKKLHDLGPGLWVARFAMLGMIVAHVGAAMRLTAMNKAARPVGYVHESTVQASYASRTMIFSGMLILAFVAIHIAHFTLPVTASAMSVQQTAVHNGQPMHDVYTMVVSAFDPRRGGLSAYLYVAIYVASNLVLGFHLAHGVGSLLQTLGLNGKRYRNLTKLAGPAVGGLVVIGNLTIPLAILAGACQSNVTGG